jgi:hypothetical protein
VGGGGKGKSGVCCGPEVVVGGFGMETAGEPPRVEFVVFGGEERASRRVTRFIVLVETFARMFETNVYGRARRAIESAQDGGSVLHVTDVANSGA